MESNTKLKISIWNANGLVNHGQEIKSFITIHNLDVLLISETHMTTKSFIKIPNYSIYYTNHPAGTARGGTAVIIKNKIKHNEIVKYSERNLQATAVEVEDWNGKLILAAVYCPPNLTIKTEQFESYFGTLGHRFIAGGDYNAKHHQWGSRLVTPRGRQLYQAMVRNNMQHLSTGQPTYWPTDINKMPDVIDFCITKGIALNYLKIESCLELSSDHSPLIVTFETKVIRKPAPPALINKNTDWEAFRNILSKELNLNIQLKSEEDVNEAVEQLNGAIQQAAWNATPLKKMVEEPGYCPEHIRRKLKEKRRLKKRWQITHAPSDKTRLNRSSYQLKKMLTDYKNQGIKKFLENLSPSESTDYSLWKVTKKIKQPQHSKPPIRTQDGNWARTDENIVNTFADHLSNVFKPFPMETLPEEQESIQQILDAPYQMDLPIKPIKKAEIMICIKNLKPKKAPGYDLITGEILKNLSPEGIKMITIIFNAILRLGYFPSQWKVAQIILILKPGKDATETASYRPISLLPVLSKVFERIFVAKLKPLLEEKQIIPNHQFGFRQNHSTVEQVHRLVKKIRGDLEHKRYCSAAFLDISQAFDKVWHAGLIYKIKTILPHPYCQVLKSYLSDRYFLVKYGDAYSTLSPIESGVPQGSVLGPLLYLLYTTDLPTNSRTETATYADDTAIMASHQDPNIASKYLQEHLVEVEKWMKKWRIKPNGTKSIHITFTLRRDTCPPVSLNSIVIPQSEEVKYLGLHLDRRLTWAKHIWKKRLQLGLIYRKMYWMMSRDSHLKLENKLLIYKAIIKPVWTYGIQLWGSASDSNIMKLQRFQSKTLRAVCNAPWYVSNDVIHRDLCMATVKEEIAAASKKYQLRLGAHPNILASNLLVAPNTKRLKRLDTLDLPQRN